MRKLTHYLTQVPRHHKPNHTPTYPKTGLPDREPRMHPIHCHAKYNRNPTNTRPTVAMIIDTVSAEELFPVLDTLAGFVELAAVISARGLISGSMLFAIYSWVRSIPWAKKRKTDKTSLHSPRFI
ncbi:hypothetical protein AG1IA_07101 [Rhizoctonia solani AG-1 IA]|uniref:Uncharacterized protein n=1 Tax=Thanatephorus cucumeris (strain AG1-IA) TaxID=983506 RepID=L8WQ23_THACA|nr:hypothetical protein AG1IA_07101 [Rhizoctonia solani AG-1 IA]